MAKKDRRATESLNVELAGIDSALTVIKSMLGDDHPAIRTIDTALERCESARQALISIQFHSQQI